MSGRITAWKILESGATSESALKRAELYLYLDRTKVLEAANPEPVVKLQPVTEVFLLEEQTGGGGWKTLEVYTDERRAAERLQNLEHAAAASDGYWEVRVKTHSVSK